MDKKRSFWERLTGNIHIEEEEETKKIPLGKEKNGKGKKQEDWIEEENEEAELAVDVYQTSEHIIIQTFVAGVRPEDLDIAVARDTATIKGKRDESRMINDNDYFSKELYWGRFSRTIDLPAEVEPEEVEAIEKHGLLTLKIKKVDKDKKSNIRVRSV